MFWKIFFDSLLLIAIILAAGWVVASVVARSKRTASHDESQGE